jgi:hypothetical protein
MPTESILVVGVVVLAFALFGAALAWVDFTTSKGRKAHETPAE